MATILFIKEALFTLSVDDGTTVTEFQGDAADVHVEVEAGDTVTYPTLDGAIASNNEAETYSLVMRAGQDYSSTGLARYLWDNKGKVANIELNAHNGTVRGAETPSIIGKVTLIPVQYGGEVNAFAEFEVTLPFTEVPTLDSTVPAP